MTLDAASRFATEEYTQLFARVDAVRVHRAAFLAQVESGTEGLESVFQRSQTDPVIHGMKVLPVIEGMPDYGKVQTRRAFGDVGIDEADHLSAVTAEHIAGLPDALERHAR